MRAVGCDQSLELPIPAQAKTSLQEAKGVGAECVDPLSSEPCGAKPL